MDFSNITDKQYAEGIDNLLEQIEKETSSHNGEWVAHKLGIHSSALSRARKTDFVGKRFGKMSRKELLDKIAKIGEHNFTWHFDNTVSKIICVPAVSKSILGNASDRQIYKVYYWRGDKMKVGVGVFIATIKEGRWNSAIMLIDNQYQDFKNEDPYVLVSKNISQYEKTTYVDLIDITTTNAARRQLAIFYTPNSDTKNRPLVEGIFATHTTEHKPISGVMMMEEMDPEEKQAFIDAEISDTESTFTNRRKVLKQIHSVPPIFYNALYGKRLSIKGVNLVSVKALPNYKTWKSLSSFVGIYEGHHIRATKGVVQCFLLAFHENGSAVVHLPRSVDGLSREPVEGQFKWVSQPKHTLTASFDYNPDEDHWRFRFILDGEDDQGCLYGIFAGTDVKTGEPISGRVRLKIILAEKSSNGQHQTIDEYHDRLRQIKLYTQEYFDLLRKDQNLEHFFNGQSRPNYTDLLSTQTLDIAQKNSDSQETKKNTSFIYAGDYNLYTLYRYKIGRKQRYYILKHPVRINNDRSVEVKVRHKRIIFGKAVHQSPVLKINFSEEETAYSHILFTVNQLAYDRIDHVYGVLTGVHVENQRSEATIAVLVGNYSTNAEIENGKPRGISFDISEYQEFEVGKKDFFELDSGDPAKIATFISGHFNRYISPPATPNLEMQSRLSKYRLPYFKAACYAGLAYTRVSNMGETFTGKKQELEKLIKFEYSLFKEAMEEAFQHGFCDPVPLQSNSENDYPKPEDDIDLLIKELSPGGSMVLLTKDVLNLCDLWNRPKVREAFKDRYPEFPIKFSKTKE